ncbi:unnamed protein product [Medioppia subpectinata]|uniref:Uncharacterized protein n=1 Tax=Medioppia subpectinata TaxID=1979941 RepID=A0A7R9KTS7_9ACAR|nr:unnamed protein product [Medioppia subpectinata]CAG2109590.1 unnamed protein product [Medioppia subpectinata]
MTAQHRFECIHVDRACLKSLIKHNCWTAIVLGALMLSLGIVLKSSVIDTTSATVQSSGMLFILIGIFVILMGPFAALYDLISKRNRRREREANGQSPSGSGPSGQSDSADPPTYSQAMTSAVKGPSATYTMRYGPQVLSPQNLTQNADSRPPPPTYEEVVLELGNRPVPGRPVPIP